MHMLDFAQHEHEKKDFSDAKSLARVVELADTPS
jgi:hypothetical protein